MFFKSWLGAGQLRSVRRLAACAFSLLVLVMLSACSVTTTSGGTLDIDWTVAGSVDPNECTTVGAQSVSITLIDSLGVESGSTVVSCGSLSTSFLGLNADTYQVNASLLDANGNVLVSDTSVVSVADTGTTDDEIAFEAPLSGAGSLTVTWTVEDSAASNACEAAGARTIQLALFDATGAPVGDAETADCEAFSATITNLPAGNYSLTAQLFDASGAAVTTLASTDGITIAAGQPQTQAVNFSASSFVSGGNSSTGSIAVTWTIEESNETASCDKYSASSISIQLYEADGVTPVGDASVISCVAFQATLTNLTPGTYTIGAQLVNAVMPVSSAIPPQPITVGAGATSKVVFDFPASAF